MKLPLRILIISSLLILAGALAWHLSIRHSHARGRAYGQGILESFQPTPKDHTRTKAELDAMEQKIQRLQHEQTELQKAKPSPP